MSVSSMKYLYDTLRSGGKCQRRACNPPDTFQSEAILDS